MYKESQSSRTLKRLERRFTQPFYEGSIVGAGVFRSNRRIAQLADAHFAGHVIFCHLFFSSFSLIHKPDAPVSFYIYIQISR